MSSSSKLASSHGEGVTCRVEKIVLTKIDITISTENFQSYYSQDNQAYLVTILLSTNAKQVEKGYRHCNWYQQ
jgi:hypothetical protein